MQEPSALAQGLTGSGYKGSLYWVLLTAHSHKILGIESIDDILSQMATSVRVLPRELPQLRARWLDVDPCPSRDAACARTAAWVWDELKVEPGFHAVACRHGRRWSREYRSLDAAQSQPKTVLREGGRYLITGGLGRMGLSLAQYLTQKPDVRVALTHSRELPPVESWSEVASGLAATPPENTWLHTTEEDREFFRVVTMR